jgi:DNA uptake protein ComE-like DNA-binding protein
VTRARTGVALLVVLSVVVVTALVGVGALDTGRAIASAARTTADDTTARAIASAGVRAVAEQLLDQRDALLDGEDASLPATIELWREGDTRAVAQLLPIGPADGRAASEAAKLHVNRASADMLARLPMLDETLAGAITSARPPGGFASVYDLLDIEGVTPELLLGDTDLTQQWGADDDSAPGVRATRVDQTEAALIDLLTTASAEPNIQRGLGDAGDEYAGEQRINLNRAWNEEMGEAVRRRYDDDVANIARGVVDNFDLASEERFITVLRQLGAPTSDWGGILDVFTTTPDPYLIGRIDLNRAPEAVLACAPGMEEVASDVVARRASLSDEDARTRTWLVTEGLLRDGFERAASWLATRSLQWRIRVRTGVAPMDAEDVVELEHERVTEIVVDLAAPRPRLAELIDLTQRPLLARFVRTPEDEDDTPQRVEPVRSAGPVARGVNPTFDLSAARAESDPSDRSAKDGQAAQVGENDGRTSAEDTDGVDRRTGRWTRGPSGGDTPREEPSR